MKEEATTAKEMVTLFDDVCLQKLTFLLFCSCKFEKVKLGRWSLEGPDWSMKMRP